MAVTPTSRLILLKCDLQIDSKNQLTFNNANEQFDYFYNLPKYEYRDVTYQRHESRIRIDTHIDNLLDYTYVMYQNDNYSNKWFYAYIAGMNYVNDYRTDVFIKTDVWQTWQFDLQFMQSFVEREHIAKSADVPGANLIPERT